MPNPFHAGQRWVSESEPELGLGTVLAVSPRTVSLEFAATGDRRDYALDHGALVRARWHAGEVLTTLAGQRLTVAAATERAGLWYYAGAGLEVCETELSPTLAFNAPRPRMRAGHFDPLKDFELRLAALGHQHRHRQSELRGLLGGRIDLIPHQLAIAAEVARRLVPRVLLADEVGLGKTIEAGLILHRLHLTGRARRVLILVPESLLHQWFLELFRRFNLHFHLYDQARCEALEGAGAQANPFLDDQLVLCGLELFTTPAEGGRRLDQAVAAGWDMLVVDEAHHLQAGTGAGYAAVARLAAGIPGLMLLTGTPEQLGEDGHFDRLRLLDPVRFHDRQAYRDQAPGFRAVADLAEQVIQGGALAPAELDRLAELLGLTPEAVRAELDHGPARAALLARLLDQHGTGRIFFRNTRARIQGFPRRVPRLAPLPDSGDPGRQRALAREFALDLEGGDGKGQPALTQDPRIHWLVQLLRASGPDKILLICRSRSRAEAIEAALQHHLKVKTALFHEGLTLLQRDRGAAWFAEKSGARLLICSELGSEGRNFQFAHDLVLFDLPLDPGLLEQRIGRLDRIGQSSDIQIHVPYLAGSPQEVLARWYHEGLDAFARIVPGGPELLDRFRSRLLALAEPGGDRSGLEGFLAESRQACAALAQRLEAGRDRLLELNALGTAGAADTAALVQALQAQDGDPGLDRFLGACFEQGCIAAEEVAPRTWQLGSMGVLAESFPGLPAEGLTCTTDRGRALVREDLQFLTWDHPLATGALDLVLGSQAGNSCFAQWPDGKGSGLYLEGIFLLECLAPASLQADRFLPPTPLRVLVDARGRDLGPVVPPEILARVLRPAAVQPRAEWLEDLLPGMLEEAQALATRQVPTLVTRARRAMAAQLGQELDRLAALHRASGRPLGAEHAALLAQRRDLDAHLAKAGLRLDALRLIHRGR
jgi:ATP-dependent helicase HepA